MSDRRQAFTDAVDALLEEYRDIVAPTNCPYGCEQDECEHSPEDGVQVEGTVPHGWVLIHEWASLDGDWFDWEKRKGMTLTAALGLVGAMENDLRRQL